MTKVKELVITLDSGKDITLTMEEAKSLQIELSKLFAEPIVVPSPSYPSYPTFPPSYPTIDPGPYITTPFYYETPTVIS